MNKKERDKFEGKAFGYYDLPTAFIDARLKDGRLYNSVDGVEVALINNALVRLVVFRKDIPEEQRALYTEQRKEVLSTGSILRFEVKGGRRAYPFEVKLIAPGMMYKKANKPSLFSCGEMVLTAVGDSDEFLPKPIQVGTLNQAYFQMSMRINPQGRSHTVNVYETFHVDGKLLKSFRF